MLCGINVPFGTVFPANGHIIYALLTRLPLSIAASFDLHVLGTPPAFVLSQDQTLRRMVLPDFRRATLSIDRLNDPQLQFLVCTLDRSRRKARTQVVYASSVIQFSKTVRLDCCRASVAASVRGEEENSMTLELCQHPFQMFIFSLQKPGS